jgi:hypothetical protein
VTGAGVVGVLSPLHGENVGAFVTLDSAAGRPTAEELVGFAGARIGDQAPGGDRRAGASHNATGKVDRMTLKRLAAG